MNGERPISKRGFGQRLQERGFAPGRAPHGARLWLGLGLLTIAPGDTSSPVTQGDAISRISQEDIELQGGIVKIASPYVTPEDTSPDDLETFDV